MNALETARDAIKASVAEMVMGVSGSYAVWRAAVKALVALEKVIKSQGEPHLLVYVFGDNIITLPAYVESRWNQCIDANGLLMWRSFGFLLSAEAKMAEIEGNNDMRDDLITLFEVAMQRVYSLQADFYAQEPKSELEKV
jgi:hypothetical protein